MTSEEWDKKCAELEQLRNEMRAETAGLMAACKAAQELIGSIGGDVAVVLSGEAGFWFCERRGMPARGRKKSMKKNTNTEAAETDQTTDSPAVVHERLVRLSRGRPRSLSESKVEEIIATLWTILWAILFVNHAPEWMLWITGLKAIGDHLCAVLAAIREIRSENVKVHTPLPASASDETGVKP